MLPKLLTFSKKLLNIGIGILIIGFLFKIQHWPFGNELVLIGFVSIAFFYSIQFIFKTEKTLIDYTRYILLILWFLNGIFRVCKFSFTEVLGQIFLGFFILWSILELRHLKSKNKIKKTEKKSTTNWFILLSASFIIIGTFFKLLHWPGSSLLLIFGFFSSGFWFFFLRKCI